MKAVFTIELRILLIFLAMKTLTAKDHPKIA